MELTNLENFEDLKFTLESKKQELLGEIERLELELTEKKDKLKKLDNIILKLSKVK